MNEKPKQVRAAKASPLKEFEDSIIRTAAYFTAFVQHAPGSRERQEFPVEGGNRPAALRQAREAAKTLGPRALVYAVTEQGRSTHIAADWDNW